MNSQDVILGMLMKKSLTGYEIKHLLEELLSYFYKSSYGTIYPMLNRMEKEGQITKENVIQEGKPNKNVYTITTKGREYFHNYLLGPIEEDSSKSDFLMRLYFGEFVGYDKLIAWLKQAQVDGLRKLKELQTKYSLHKEEMHPAQMVCIQIGIKEYSAKLEAITEGLKNMEQLDQSRRE